MAITLLRRRSFLSAALGAVAMRGWAQSRAWIMYVGTYTKPNCKGIYAWRFDSAGKFTPLGLMAETSNPSFLAIDSTGHYLYAANEDQQGKLSAFAIDRSTAELKPINSVSSKGDSPCHVALDRTGKWLFAANYNSGSVASFPIAAGGKLGEAAAFLQHTGSSVNKERQTGPHAHMAAVSPDNRFVLVPDLGTDRVMVYNLDVKKGSLTSNGAPLRTAAGFGPRHLAFGKDARFVYVLGELAGAVDVFQYDTARGGGEQVQSISMLPEGYSAVPSGAEIVVDASGKFLYASNRGHDSIAIFRIDAANGTLTAVDRPSARAKTPRNFAIDPTNNFLLAGGQDSNKIAVFRIDQGTGKLTAAGDPFDAPVPVCITFTPAG
jgi:6-phosphogluconolactonase